MVSYTEAQSFKNNNKIIQSKNNPVTIQKSK